MAARRSADRYVARLVKKALGVDMYGGSNPEIENACRRVGRKAVGGLVESEQKKSSRS